ncbi:MAG: nucleotidyltransferase domain-containing protein [Opitutaceae bacterium]|nr:nucleotidyltransferase domain-containing protein [Opitutaceae bacterium]
MSLADLRSVAGAVCQRHPVARLELFGSLTGGRMRPDSDVDLLVEFLPDSKPGLLEMGALQDELEHELGRKVDLLSRRAVEQSRNLYRRRSILARPVTLYAR